MMIVKSALLFGVAAIFEIGGVAVIMYVPRNLSA